MKEPRLNLCPAASKGTSAASMAHIRQLITERHQIVISVVIDQIDRAAAVNGAGRLHIALYQIHWRAQDLHICDADNLHIAWFSHCPRRIIVDISLRIVGRPVLIINQRVGYATARLVHAHDVRAGGNFLSSVFDSFFGVAAGDGLAVAAGAAAGLSSPSLSSPFFFTVTVKAAVARLISTPCACSSAEQFGLVAGPRIVAGQNISRGSFIVWLSDRTFALQVKVLQKKLRNCC